MSVSLGSSDIYIWSYDLFDAPAFVSVLVSKRSAVEGKAMGQLRKTM